MKKQIAFAAVGILFVGPTNAHEFTSMGASAQEIHALYHKAKDSFPRVDLKVIKQVLRERDDTFSWYFDLASNSLYSCIGDKEPVFCTGPERAEKFVWSAAEIDYGTRNGLRPSDRKLDRQVYVLEAQPPFTQATAWVWYAGGGRVVRCRSTFTQFNFEAEIRGAKVFIDSTREPDLVQKCEQLFPR